MSKQQIDLAKSKKKKRWTDPALVSEYATGEVELGRALGLDAEAVQALRRQAVALYESGKWQRCIDVVLGVVALGSVHPVDALLLAGSYKELGQVVESEQCAAHARQLFNAMGLTLPEWLEREEGSES